MAAKRTSTVTPRKPRPPSKRFKLKIVIHEAEEGGYWAEVPGFGGCVSEGEALDEVRANIREAFEGVFEVMQDVATEEPGRVEEIDL
jgi:predicted RNase H-like HicB family nuclease